MCQKDVSTLDICNPQQTIVAWCLVDSSIWAALGLLDAEVCRRTDDVWSGWRGMAESLFGIDAACIEQVRASLPPDAKDWQVMHAVRRVAAEKAQERGWPVPHFFQYE